LEDLLVNWTVLFCVFRWSRSAASSQ